MAIGDILALGPNSEFRIDSSGNVISTGSVTSTGAIASSSTLTGTDVNVTADAAAAGTGVVATSEQLQVRTLTLTLTSVAVALTDEAGVIAYGGLKIVDFPAGLICILGAVMDLDVTKSSAGVNTNWDGDVSLGSAAAGNDADLTGTEADIIAKTSTPQAVAGVTTANAKSTATECPVYLDGTGTAADVYLNFLVDDADHDVGGTACNLLVTGTIKITYVNLGDY